MVIKLQSRNLKYKGGLFAILILALCIDSSARSRGEVKISSRFIQPVAVSTQARTVQVSINSEAALLITDGQGQKLGFDTEKQRVVNEIPSASVNYETRFPAYLLPLDNSGKPYTILISGKPLKSKVETNLTLTGPGFVVGFKGIRLNPSENLNATVSLDGRQLTFMSSQPGETPTLSYAVSAGHSKPSYKFEVSVLKLSSGKSIAATLDTNAGRLFFKDDDEKKNNYSVMMRRTNPDGTQNVYQRHDISFSMSDNYVMEYGKWDGRGPICFKVDDGKGFDNSACIELPNEAVPVSQQSR